VVNLGTIIEQEINECIDYNEIVNLYTSNALHIHLKEKDLANLLKDIKTVNEYSRPILNFLNKYGNFFNSVDQKFGTGFNEACNSAKRIANDILRDCKNVNINASEGRFDAVEAILNETTSKARELKNVFAKIITIPHVVDFSNLSHEDLKKIGVVGIHYKGRVFLSYPFRDKDPSKDENQKLIDYYIVPFLELLDVEPVTARKHLESQGLIDDDTIKLVKDCDGIVGFFTMNDSIANVEHELSNNPNIAAIFVEEGATAPSMRRSRLQFDFRRTETGFLLMNLTKALKDKGLFRLVI
jgi:hypothetical protein